MTPAKRLFDLGLALLLLALTWPLALLVAMAIALLDGRPVLYRGERMTTARRGFVMLKFRTMRLAPRDAGVTGGDKAARISGLGRLLRRSHLDEWPQLWNILRGEMSFVGPRPPLRRYVERDPALYARVLRARPGLTGLATLHCAAWEARLLARCRDAAQTERVYVHCCIPVKARLDLLYQRRRSLWRDIALLARSVLGRGGRRARRRGLPRSRMPRAHRSRPERRPRLAGALRVPERTGRSTGAV